MNASITFANCVVGNLLWRKLPAYVIGQFLGSMLMIGILAIHDRKNAGALPGTNAFITGLLVVLIGMSMGMNTGYAINPSRDLPPRIFTALAGWGLEIQNLRSKIWRPRCLTCDQRELLGEDYGIFFGYLNLLSFLVLKEENTGDPLGEDWEKKDGSPSAPMGAALENGHLAQCTHLLTWKTCRPAAIRDGNWTPERLGKKKKSTC
ncbi:hypothetical protein E2320_017887 [Naja naja]|nr:hypothetical protein E2320_017887 [Naja naja]